MSFADKYEYISGEYQDLERVMMEPSGTAEVWMIDPDGVKLAGYNILLWDAESGGNQLVEGSDFSLVFQDTEKSGIEVVNIWAGYHVITPAYQGIPLYLDIRLIGGYTKFQDTSGRIIEEYEQGSQHVTKWDTGRMEITLRITNILSPVSVDYAEAFTSSPSLSSGMVSYAGMYYTGDYYSFLAFAGANETYQAYFNDTVPSNVSLHVLAIGMWK